MSEIIDAIANCWDKSQLEAITKAASKQLARIERNQKSALRLICHNNTWYVIRTENQREAINLGARLAPHAVLRRSRKKPPTPADFHLPDNEAKALQSINPNEVGWWEEPDKSSHYYNAAEYDKARATFREWYALATHPIAMTHGLTVEGMRTLQELENKGYEVAYPE